MSLMPYIYFHIFRLHFQPVFKESSPAPSRPITTPSSTPLIAAFTTVPVDPSRPPLVNAC